jgi:hypothetical protein
VELVAHLAVLDTRPALYAAHSYGSLFGYCTKVLRLSEDAACNRIEAARACQRFPVILDMLASGEMSLTSVRLVGRLLTAENHQAVLARACGRSRRQIEALVAELAPRPDVATSGSCPRRRQSRCLSPRHVPRRRSFRRAVRSSTTPRRSAIASSSRSARRATTSFDACRPFSVARSRTAIRQRFSIAPSRCSSRRWRGPSLARRRSRGRRVLPVPGRIRRAGDACPLRAMCRVT